jgi:hypothetical protein
MKSDVYIISKIPCSFLHAGKFYIRFASIKIYTQGIEALLYVHARTLMQKERSLKHPYSLQTPNGGIASLILFKAK